MFKKPLIKLTFLAIFTFNANCQVTDSLLSILEKSEGRVRIEILHQLVISHWLNYPDRAMIYGEEALDISEDIRDSLIISKSLQLIAGVHYYQADLVTSLDYNLRAMEIAFSLGDSILIANSYNNLGLLYFDLGNYQASLENLLRARDMKLSLGETYALDLVLNNIGLVYERVSNFEKARKNFRDGYEISLTNNNLNVQVYSQNNIGITYLKEGKFELARSYFESALLLANEIHNIKWGAVSLRNIGEILRYEGKYDSANYYCQRSLAACESIHEKTGIAESYLFLAKLYLDQDEIEVATKFLDKSHKITSTLNMRFQLLENLRLYASIHLVDKDNKKVILNQLKYLDLRDSLFQDAISRNLDLVPIKIKEEYDRIKLSQQQVELENQGFINSLYVVILIGVVPILFFLIVLLRKNKITNKELRGNNQKLIKTQNLLITSEKMASLGVLAAGVGHEINNPLNYIKNGINALSASMDKINKKEKQDFKKYFDIINEGVDRASKIVKSLSHFSREGVDENEFCDVERILDNCLLISSKRLLKIEVKKHYTKKSAIIHGNEGKLHQAFMNLISNAEQAIDKRGKIEISTETRKNQMIVSIKDSGIGISEENLLKIGDPFFTTKPPGEGTGLGLSITYAIINEHKGDIQVISEPNSGTEFIITLPLHRRN